MLRASNPTEVTVTARSDEVAVEGQRQAAEPGERPLP
jgi:hypothetical protein